MNTGGKHRFYITRPIMLSMTWIAKHIQSNSNHDEFSYNIIFVPRKLETCDFILENEGVYGSVRMFEWDLHLIPLDAHILSLERYESFKNMYLDNDFTIFHSIAKSIMILEDIYGTIPVVHGKGHKAQMIWELFSRLKEVMKVPSKNKQSGSEISQMIILDRQCDFITPLCSQLTYEGILDDVLDIKSGYVHIPKEISGGDHASKVLVNTKDPVFGVIRSLYFSSVSQTLSAITKSLKTSYTEGKSLSSIPELKSFVQTLPDLTKKHESLSIHTKVSEHIADKMKKEEFQRQLYFERAIFEAVEKTQITDFIEEYIQRQMPFRIALRLICLMSATNNGIKPKYFLSLKRAFLHSYGHKHLVTFHNLFKVGLLQQKEEEQSKGSKSTFKQLTKQLKLVPKDPGSYDVHSPKDMSYVYGGAYKPLSCAVVEYLVRTGNWKGLDDVIKTWDGPTFTKYNERTAASSTNRTILVYFVGGVTFSEINALQSLGKQTNTTYIVATTNTLNRSSLINSTLGNDM